MFETSHIKGSVYLHAREHVGARGVPAGPGGARAQLGRVGAHHERGQAVHARRVVLQRRQLVAQHVQRVQHAPRLQVLQVLLLQHDELHLLRNRCNSLFITLAIITFHWGQSNKHTLWHEIGYISFYRVSTCY